MIKTKLISDIEYSATKLPARECVLLQARLAKVLGGAGDAVSILDVENEQTFIAAIGKFASSIDPVEMTDLLVYICELASVKGKKINFDYDFNDDIMRSYKVAYFVLEVNFTDFLGGVARSTLGDKLKNMTQP